jgi:hypothetical protein
MAIPGTPEYHKEWTQKKAIADAAAATARAAREAQAYIPEPGETLTFESGPVSSDRASYEGALPPGGGMSDAEMRGAQEAAASPKQTAREAALASMRARGLPTPGQEVAAAEGLSADTYEQAGLSGLGMQGAKMLQTGANPEYGITKQYIDTSRGVNDRAMAAQQAIDDAEMQRAAKVADFMDEQSARQDRALVDMRARQYAQEEHALEAQKRTENAYGIAAQATEQLMKAQSIDPGRWWASRTAGQKFAAGLGAVARGLAGGDSMAFINKQIADDIDAQKASFAQKQAALGAAQNQGALARGIYADIRAQTQDEREADEVMRLARLEQAKSQFESIAARSAIPSVMAAQQQFRLQLEQQIADTRFKLGRLAAHNVKSRTVAVPAYRVVKDPETGAVYQVPIAGPGQLKAAEYALKEASASRADARKMLGDEAIEGVKAGNKARDDARAAQERASTSNQAALQKFGESIAAERELYGLIDDFVAKYQKRGGVPGRGGSRVIDVFSPNETASAEAELVAIKDAIGRMKSGGAITEDELATFSKMAEAGFGDEQLYRNLRSIQRGVQLRMQAKEQGVSDEARAEYRRIGRGELPGYSPDLSGIRDPTTSAADDAAALGGRLR